jgi:uncharacterized membrane protein
MAETQQRIPWVDALRGLAIILMVPANLSPYFTEPHPMWFRILGSFAAPVFIMLSAGMVILTAERHSLRYFLKRGGLIILTGALIDIMLWKIFPFTSFDVLYPIGLALPLMYLLRNVESRELLYITIIFVIGTYVLQAIFGYHAETLEVYFNDMYLPSVDRIVQSWFIDGWFPIFPWLGYAVLGALLFRTIFAGDLVARHHIMGIGTVLTVIGFVLLFVPVSASVLRNLANESILEVRGGYSEIFYPPTFAYIFTSTGLVILFATILRKIHHVGPLGILAFFGKHSMMVYILHQAMGALIIEPWIASMGLEAIDSGMVFTGVNIAVLAGIALICFGIDRIKLRRPPQSTYARILFGR